MRSWRRLTPGRDEAVRELAVGPDCTATALWQREVPGIIAHAIAIDAGGGSVYVGDGGLVAFAALRFRRLDLATGAELASYRSHNAVRCIWRDPGSRQLIAALDTRLVQLDPLTLAEVRRWDRRIPRYPDTVAVRSGVAVLANGIGAGVGLVDLESGRVRRRPTGEQILVLNADPLPLVVETERGGISTIDPVTGRMERVAGSPQCQGAAVAEGGQAVWITAAPPTSVDWTGRAKVDVQPPGRAVRRICLDGTEADRSFLLPVAASRIFGGVARFCVVTGEARDRGPGPLGPKHTVVTVPLPAGSDPVRMWKAPRGESVRMVDADAGLVVTAADHEETSTFRLYRLDC